MRQTAVGIIAFTLIVWASVIAAQTPAAGPPPRLTAHGDPPDPTNVSDELKKIYAAIDGDFNTHVERLRQWVRIPNISNTVEGEPGVWASATFLRDLIIKELGCQAEVRAPGISEWGGPSHPIVYGRCEVGAEKTVLDYIQADVMPVWREVEKWPLPPFGGEMVAKPPFRKVMYGRGVNNQKGKEMAQLNALIAIKKVTGTLPVNVIFLADHDEERMELGPRTFMMANPDLFKDADVAFGYAGSQRADGYGEIAGQSIGTVAFELQTSGIRPGRGLGQQPMARHMKMLASLYGNDEDGDVVAIKGINDGALPPSPEEREYLRQEAAHANRPFEELLQERTAVRVGITGTWGGNMVPGPNAGNITPVVATSKVDIRFPPGIEGEQIVERVRAHLKVNGYDDVKLTVIGIVPWSWANADNEMGAAIKQMYRQFNVPFIEPPKGNYMGTWTAYGPPYLFTRGPLQIPHLRGGLGYGNGAHLTTEGEYYVIEGDGQRIYGFAGAMKSAATVLYNYAGKSATR